MKDYDSELLFLRDPLSDGFIDDRGRTNRTEGNKPEGQSNFETGRFAANDDTKVKDVNSMKGPAQQTQIFNLLVTDMLANSNDTTKT